MTKVEGGWIERVFWTFYDSPASDGTASPNRRTKTMGRIDARCEKCEKPFVARRSLLGADATIEESPSGGRIVVNCPCGNPVSCMPNELPVG